MSTIERPLSERDAAHYIGISVHTLRKWRKAGKAPAHFSASRVIRYPKKELDEFIAAHTTTNAGGQHEQ